MNTLPLSEFLQQGLNDIKINLSDEQQSRLIQYLQLMTKWNQAYNLTAITDPLSMVSHHLLDSLAIIPHLHGTHHIDVGSGAGLPGIPLAIALPEHSFTLLDSNGKKTRFLNQAKLELNLSNVEIIQNRVENYTPTNLYDTITSRAFASLSDMINWTQHICASEGQFLAMKGILPTDEIAALPQGFKIKSITPLFVPGVIGERHLLIICKTKVK